MRFNAGDVVFTRGNGLKLWAVRFLTHSRYGHCLIAVRTENGLKFLESGRGKVRLSDTSIVKEDMFSVVDMSKKTNDFTTLDWTLTVFMEKNLGREYEKNWWQMLGAMVFQFFRIKLNNKETSSFFCSELIAQLMIDKGYLDGKIASNNYTPQMLFEALKEA